MLSRTLRTLTLPVLASLLVAGCNASRYSVGPERSAEQRRAQFPFQFEDYAKLGYRQDWVGYPAITGSLPVRFVQPYDDFIATLEQGSTLTILEPNTGGRRCAVQLSNPLTKFTGITRDEGNGRLIVSSDADVFFIDTQTCNMVDRQEIEKIVATEPVRYGNLFIFGTNVGEILAHLSTSAAPGVKAWGFATGAAIEHNPVLIGAIIGAVNQAGEVLFLDALSGSLVGRNRVYGGLRTNPVADEQAMYFASEDQSVYAFAPTGQLLWRHRTASPLTVQPTLHNDRLYVGIVGEGLVAFDAASGEQVWRAPDLAGVTIVAQSRQGLIGFDPRTEDAFVIETGSGDIIERVQLRGVQSLKADRFEGGNLYALTRSGVLAKFQPR
jgi:outer membrane protein assembly factor BamB